MGYLIIYLLGVLTGSRQDQKRSQHQADNSAQERDDGQHKRSVTAEIRFPVEEKREWRESQEKQNSLQKSLVIATWFTFAAVFIYAGITLVTYVEIKNGRQQTNKQFRADQRAWLSYSWPEKSIYQQGSYKETAEYAVQHVNITNFGKTPARRVTAEFIAALIPSDKEPTFNYEASEQLTKYVEIEGIIFPNASFMAEVKVSGVINGKMEFITVSDFRKRLETGTDYLVFYGRIWYTDVFGVDHWTRLCSGGIGSIPKTRQPASFFPKCIQYNEVDNNE